MRKSDCYGVNPNPVDFEWPKPSDIRQMSKKTLIKLAKFNYKARKSGDRFSAFQLIL